MSDDTPSQRHAARRLPKRQDWLPNRMFDPVNNPFAIQNLLACEREKEDALFHIGVAGPPGTRYAGNPLLKASEILPPKDFALNRLLDETTRFDQAFHAEYDELDDDHDVTKPDGEPEAISAIAAPDGVAEVTETASLPLADAPGMAAAATRMTDPPTDTPGNAGERLAPSDPMTDPHAGHQLTAELAAADRDDPAAETEQERPADTSAHGSRLGDEAPTVTDVAQANASSAIPASPDLPPQDAEPEQTTTDAATDNLLADTATETQAPSGSMLGTTEATVSEVPAIASSTSADELPTSAEGDAEAPNATASHPSDENETASTLHERSAFSRSDVASEAAQVTDANPGAAPSSVPVMTTDTQTTEEPLDSSSALMHSRLEAAREEAREEARVEAREAAFQEGWQAGRDQAMSELQQSLDDKLAQLNQLLEELRRLSDDPDTLFAPMKKLAVHLAEQLVRGELSQSAQTISRLVDNCLRELAASGEKAVIVHLNPEDLEQYKPLIAPLGDSILLRPDATLMRGSVRTSLDGSVVEDLIERRVKGLQKSLAQPVAGSWRPSIPNPLVQRPQPQPTATPSHLVSQSPLAEQATDATEITEAIDDTSSVDMALADAVPTHSDAAATDSQATGIAASAAEDIHRDTEPGAAP